MDKNNISEEAELIEQPAPPDFGFGVPEERKELDPMQFDEEVDTKNAKVYSKAQELESEAGGFFDDFLGEENEEFSKFSKMPHSIKEF